MKSLTTIILLSLVSLVISTNQLSAQTLEQQLSEVLQHEAVEQYFGSQNPIVISPNKYCNKLNCKPENIAARKDVKIYDKQEAFMRNLRKAMTVIDVQVRGDNITRFNIQLGNESLTIDVKS